VRCEARRIAGEIDDMGRFITGGGRLCSPWLLTRRKRHGLVTVTSTFTEIEHSDESITGDDRGDHELLDATQRQQECRNAFELLLVHDARFRTPECWRQLRDRHAGRRVRSPLERDGTPNRGGCRYSELLDAIVDHKDATVRTIQPCAEELRQVI
jgi:hypothetical protein